MYLTLQQHDLFRTLLMGFEIPLRSFVVQTILQKYDTYPKFQNALNTKRDSITPSDPVHLRNMLPSFCSEKKCSALYDKMEAAANNVTVNIIVGEQDIPMVGELNLLTFAFTAEFARLYALFGGYADYCLLAEKYRYDRNKLDHPGCKTLEEGDLIPVLSFVKDIITFLDEIYFSQKSRETLLNEVGLLQKRKGNIPVCKHNFAEMPYGESKIVCRQTEILKLKKFICGNPNDLRKQHACCIFGYGGVGKTALVLEVVKEIVQDILDERVLNEYNPQYIFFFSAKKQKLDISPVTGKIIEKEIHKYFKTAEELEELVLLSVEKQNLKGFHEEGIIIVDNLEALSEEERQNVKKFVEARTPTEMQFLLTSRNSEEYEVNFKLSGFEKESGVEFVNQYICENGLDLDMNSIEIDELLTLAKGNTLVLVLCLRRLSQRLSSISGLRSEFSSVNAWRSIRNGLKNFQGNTYEVISEFMFKDTFEEIEKVFVDDVELFYKILKIFAVYQGGGVDLNTICLLAKEPYPKVEAVADALCNYLILEKNKEQYSLNDFAEKYIIDRFMPDAVTFERLSSEIGQRKKQVQSDLENLNREMRNRPNLSKILQDWYILSDSDRITAARMYQLYGETKRECENDSRFKTEAMLERVIEESDEAEKITAHPFIKYQKARILQLIDRSKILPEMHTEEIITGFRNAIFVIKTVEQYSVIQQTKSYASLLWLFGQYLYDSSRVENSLQYLEESIRYLEEGRAVFEMLGIKDGEYYQCLSKLGAVYLDYVEQGVENKKRYLELARKVSDLLQKSYKRLGGVQPFANDLKRRIERWKKT